MPSLSRCLEQVDGPAAVPEAGFEQLAPQLEQASVLQLRASRIGATLSVRSARGAGTTIRMQVPN